MSPDVARVVEELHPYCDLKERLAAVPPSAKVRGLYRKSVWRALEQAGRMPQFEAVFGPQSCSTLRFYPLSEYLVELAYGGALLRGHERLHEGMFDIGRRYASAVTESLLGRTLLRLLSPEPRRLLQQGASGRRQTLTYGRWELEFPDERSAVMHMYEEYSWIESVVLGAAHGTFDTIKRPVEIRVELDNPFQGRHLFRW